MLNTAEPTITPTPSSKESYRIVAMIVLAISGAEEPIAAMIAPWISLGRP